jgi:hypothetical protein
VRDWTVVVTLSGWLLGSVGEWVEQVGLLNLPVMADATKSSILEAADSLASLLQALPADERRTKALYHLERLQLSVQASHQEAVRFAAFTVNKTIRDAATDWGPTVTAAMDALRAELHAHGHEF